MRGHDEEGRNDEEIASLRVSRYSARGAPGASSRAVSDHCTAARPAGAICVWRNGAFVQLKNWDFTMVNFALFVRLEAKPGKEAALGNFLAGALPLANAESGTTAWFALRFGPSTFGIFDAFANEADRQAHLDGPIAAALMANVETLLSAPPQIERVDLLATKLPR